MDNKAACAGVFVSDRQTGRGHHPLSVGIIPTTLTSSFSQLMTWEALAAGVLLLASLN